MQTFCPICGKKLELRNGLLYCPHCKITVGRPGKYNESYAHPKVEWRPKKAGIFNFFRVAKIALFLLVVFGVSFGIYQKFIYEEQECIPISSIYPFENPKLKENIRGAMRAILEFSQEDYYRLCQFGTKIELRDLTGYWGYYMDREDPESGERGLILIDRTVAGQYEHLDAVIIHEACHAYLFQVFDDRREAPCEQRGYEHIAKKPGVAEGEEALIPSHGEDGAREEGESFEFAGEKLSIVSHIENVLSWSFQAVVSYTRHEFDRLNSLVRRVYDA